MRSDTARRTAWFPGRPLDSAQAPHTRRPGSVVKDKTNSSIYRWAVSRIGPKGSFHPPSPIRSPKAEPSGNPQTEQAKGGINEVAKSHAESLPVEARGIEARNRLG